MTNNLPLVSIVVLSHNRPEYLPRVLDSIVSQTYPNIEVIVVDNKSSSSNELAQLVHQYKSVRLIQNSGNLGFTGGMNRGIEAASGEYVHCTLDDVVLESNCLERLVEYMRLHPSAGLLSGILYHEDGETICCAGGEFYLTATYKMKVFGAGEKDVGQFSAPYEVKYIPGGMVFCRLDFMRQLRGFRNEFFMYSEDADLCARVTKAGHTIAVVPRARARVFDAPHAFKAEGIAFHKIKNQFSLYLLHARLRVLPEFYLRYGVMNLVRAVGSDRSIVWPMIKAWGWFLLKSPALLRERFRPAISEVAPHRSITKDENLQSARTSITS